MNILNCKPFFFFTQKYVNVVHIGAHIEGIENSDLCCSNVVIVKLLSKVLKKSNAVLCFLYTFSLLLRFGFSLFKKKEKEKEGMFHCEYTVS